MFLFFHRFGEVVVRAKKEIDSMRFREELEAAREGGPEAAAQVAEEVATANGLPIGLVKQRLLPEPVTRADAVLMTPPGSPCRVRSVASPCRGRASDKAISASARAVQRLKKMSATPEADAQSDVSDWEHNSGNRRSSGSPAAPPKVSLGLPRRRLALPRERPQCCTPSSSASSPKWPDEHGLEDDDFASGASQASRRRRRSTSHGCDEDPELSTHAPSDAMEVIRKNRSGESSRSATTMGMGEESHGGSEFSAALNTHQPEVFIGATRQGTPVLLVCWSVGFAIWVQFEMKFVSSIWVPPALVHASSLHRGSGHGRLAHGFFESLEVVTCARSGVEYGNSLAWALCFASVLAYSLQEGSARLTLVSGKTMGQCVQEKFKTSAVGTAPRACWAFTIAVYTGCLLYQCNNFAGGVDALFAFPGMENFSQNAVRIGGCFGYGIAVIAILYQDQADAIGTGLGVVMMAMIVLFLAAAITVGFSWAELAWGFLPTLPQMSAVPDAATPCEMVLSLVGTTAIGVNLFFSGSMAVGTTMADCRRGIAFSTASALIVSLLIMIVGSGSAKEADDLGKFNIGLLADAIEHYFGKVGTFAFALGFVAAALSSMLTVVLGIVSAAEGLVLSPKDVESGALPKIPRRAFWSIAFSTVLVAMAAIIANLPRVTVILVAQLSPSGKQIVELMSPLSRRSAAFAYRMHFSRLKDRNIRNKLNTSVLFDSFAMQLSLLRSSLERRRLRQAEMAEQATVADTAELTGLAGFGKFDTRFLSRNISGYLSDSRCIISGKEGGARGTNGARGALHFQISDDGAAPRAAELQPECCQHASHSEQQQAMEKHMEAQEKKLSSASKALKRSRAQELRCVIDGKLLGAPVLSPYGHVFEEDTLKQWLTTCGSVCPITGKPLREEDCRADVTTQQKVLDWVKAARASYKIKKEERRRLRQAEMAEQEDPV
ncbi:unnamed protein product [Cladocopium goreaui]|uniref:Amino acid transporter transmembrane domain-containing protein n=1 Tax=Cladocopium goreaui TaxID=2562237 RepID=A0A9P1CK82_9DINO|nr:unnamed protein product [Cladocopium goreaui]